MNREIQNKKLKLIGKISDLLKQIENTKNPNILANLQSKANSLQAELKLLDAPSAPNNKLSSNKTNTNTLEDRLRNVREENYQHRLITDRLSSGLEELHQTITASTIAKPPTFMERLTTRLNSSNTNNMSKVREITKEEQEMLDNEFAGGKRKRKTNKGKKYFKKRRANKSKKRKASRRK